MHALDIDNPSYISCSFMDDGEDNCTRPFICDRSTFYCCLSVTIQLSTNMTSSIDNDPFVENDDDQVNRLTLQSDADHERYCGVDGRLLKGTSYITFMVANLSCQQSTGELHG
jgi:hypothetical protein